MEFQTKVPQIKSFDRLRACPSMLEAGDERKFIDSVRGELGLC
jgi:hypothetical protein